MRERERESLPARAGLCICTSGIGGQVGKIDKSHRYSRKKVYHYTERQSVVMPVG